MISKVSSRPLIPFYGGVIKFKNKNTRYQIKIWLDTAYMILEEGQFIEGSEEQLIKKGINAVKHGVQYGYQELNKFCTNCGGKLVDMGDYTGCFRCKVAKHKNPNVNQGLVN